MALMKPGETRASPVRAAVPESRLAVDRADRQHPAVPGERHGLAPKNDAGRFWVHELQLTIADLVAEIHDGHHPIASSRLLRGPEAGSGEAHQRPARDAAAEISRLFRRCPGARRHRLARRQAAQYADLSLFHVVEGLRYAFPENHDAAGEAVQDLGPLHDRVAKRPRIAAYSHRAGGSRSTPTASSATTRNWTVVLILPRLRGRCRAQRGGRGTRGTPPSVSHSLRSCEPPPP